MTISPLDPSRTAGVRASASSATSTRIDAVDLLRGVVMVLMVLDHTRDFTHATGFLHDPTDLAYTTAPIFFTRWITHLCAPTFVFLAGTGAYLQLLRGKSRGALSRFLGTRGLWLIVLEFTVVNFGISFRIDSTFLGMAQVIWVIGVSMIVLAGLIWLSLRAIAAIGLAMIVGHNMLDHVAAPAWSGPGAPALSVGNWLWTVLHQPGMLPLAADGTPMAFNLYPLVPWIGVMAAGYAFGALYRLPLAERVHRVAWMGVALVGTFLVMRTLNAYGDPRPWMAQRSGTLSVLSFMNVQKYPPSLLFLCATLGLALLLLAWFERRLARSQPPAIERVLITFGRVPLFFYLLQWYVAHGIGIVALMIAGQDYSRLLYHPLVAPLSPPGTGFSLEWVYLFWIVGVMLLYLPCRWFAGVKARRRGGCLSYL